MNPSRHQRSFGLLACLLCVLGTVSGFPETTPADYPRDQRLDILFEKFNQPSNDALNTFKRDYIRVFEREARYLELVHEQQYEDLQDKKDSK